MSRSIRGHKKQEKFKMIPFLGAIADLGGKLIDHFLPPSMSEKEKEEAKQKAKALAVQLATSETSEFHSFMLQYEGAAKDLGPWMRGLRASVRPILTYLLISTTAYLVWRGIKIPTELYHLDLLALGFWFGERAVRNYIMTKKTGKGTE